MKRKARPSESPQDKILKQLLPLAHADLACYAVATWPPFLRAPHHELIIAKLEDVERGDISRLMIFLPPQHGKSLLGSIRPSGLVSWTTPGPPRDFRYLQSRV